MKEKAAALTTIILLSSLIFFDTNYLFPVAAQATQDINAQTELKSKELGGIGQSLEDELKENQRLQDELKAKIASLQDQEKADRSNISVFSQQIATLSIQIETISVQIQQKQLEIQQLELEIQIVQDDIEELKVRIQETFKLIEDLEEETNERLVDMYLDQKQNSSTSSRMFAVDGPSSLVKSDTYRQALQQETNEKLEILESNREQLEKDQAQLEEDKNTLDRNRNTVEDQRLALDIQRVEAQNQQIAFEAKLKETQTRINGYDELFDALSSQERELLKQQDAIQAALLERGEVTNGTPIKQGDFLGIEGETGYTFGAHLHFGVSENGAIQNPCSYLPAGAYGSCGGSGRIGKPMSSATFTSGFRTSSRPSHNAIDISNGGGSAVVAAHDGYAYFFFEPCPSWAKRCIGGGAIVAKVCETDQCSGGISTVYYHLSCTAEPSSSGRSCKR